MRRTMDAFIAAVDDARRRLSQKRGEDISMSKVIEMAGYGPGQRAGVFYHLNKRKKWPRGHKVPPEIVARLAQALEVDHEVLASAAQVAAGYTVRIPGGDLPAAYARFLKEAGDAEKAAVTARLLQIIADETARGVASAEETNSETVASK